MKTHALLLALLFLASLGGPARAQDAEPEPRPEPPSLDSLPEDAEPAPEAGDEKAGDGDASGADAEANVLLSRALRSLKRQEEICVTAKVGHAAPKPNAAPGAGQPGQPGGGGMVIVRQFKMPGHAEPFEGEVEAWRDGRGRTVVVSRTAVPGFGLFTDGSRTIVRTTAESGVRIGLQEIEAELVPLLDTIRLTKRILAGDLKPIRDETTGGIIFKGTLPEATVDAIPGPELGNGRIALAGMAPRVLRVEAELTVSKEGELTAATIKVVHNDPTQEMMQGGGMRIQIVGGGGAQPVPNKNRKQKQKPIEGDASVYELRFDRTRQPTKRAKAFHDEMLALPGE